MREFNRCDNCEYFVTVFGDHSQCVKTGRIVDYEYWNNEQPADCPLKDEQNPNVT